MELISPCMIYLRWGLAVRGFVGDSRGVEGRWGAAEAAACSTSGLSFPCPACT